LPGRRRRDSRKRPGRAQELGSNCGGSGLRPADALDHIAVTPDIDEQYPAPFFEPFTTLAWPAGITDRIRLGTSVLIMPYRHPLLVARMAANMQQLSAGRLFPGVGAGRARQEFSALGVPFDQRGRLTDDHLRAARGLGRRHGLSLRADPDLDRCQRRCGPAQGRPPRRRLAPATVHVGLAARGTRPADGHSGRRATADPCPEPADRPAIDRVADHLEQLWGLGTDTVVLDPFNGDITAHPELRNYMITGVGADGR
jgi:hypothetical protein